MGDLLSFTDVKNFKNNKYQSLNSSNNGGSNISVICECPYAKEFDLRFSNIESQIKDTKNLLTILISIFGLIVPLLFSVFVYVSDKSFTSYNKEVSSKFEIIKNQIDNQRDINSVQIQRDVAIEIKNQSINKK